MTNQVGRIYVTALALVLFFLTWAVVAAQPWIAPKADPRLARLAARQTRLRHEAKLVDAIVARRFAAYRRALATRRAAAAAVPQAPAVRVVNLPPLTFTRTS